MKGKQFIEPHTDEWFRSRLGKWTASKADLLFKKGRGKDEILGQMCLSHIDVLIAEILTGEQKEAKGWQLDYGIGNEPFAKDQFQLKLNKAVTDSGFYEYNSLSGGTPDFEIENENAIGEIKCPADPKVFTQICQLDTVEELKDYDPLYYHQPQANMLFTGAEKAYFVAYDGRVRSEDLQLKVMLIYADEKWQNEFNYRLDLVSEIMNERLLKIMKVREEIILLQSA